MDILWRVGWRLKIITSSSLMCRSTLYPNWRWRSLGFGWNLRSILSPLSLIMYLAPGYWLLPRRTNSCMLIIRTKRLQLTTAEHFNLHKCNHFTWLKGNNYFFISNYYNYSYLSMLNGVTISGKVRFWAMVLGTPTWSIDKLGSGVMTARAEKSTRFPIRFPLILPSLLFSLCFTDFSGRPDFCMACENKKQNSL